MIDNVNFQYLDVAFVLRPGKSITCLGLKAISKMFDDEKDSKQVDSRPL